MPSADPAAILDALDEPALLVRGDRVLASNAAATAVLGRTSSGSDVRLAIRHPAALAAILSDRRRDVEVTGIGNAERPWTVTVRPIGDGLRLVRLVDQAAVRAAERIRVDFVANASHELRTPLATILGYAETLAEDGDLDSATRGRFGATILGEARRMLRIIEDLMGLSRIEGDRFVRPSQKVSIAEVADLAAARAAELASRRGCSVEMDIAADLPAVTGDCALLVQLIDNLLSNAIRYGCNAKSSIVRLAARRSDGTIAIIVSDEGDGIAQQHLPRLTERFYRVDAARSRDSGGTGLGLAIVKHIVERHRGRLDIHSLPGSGTRVVVELPIE